MLEEYCISYSVVECDFELTLESWLPRLQSMVDTNYTTNLEVSIYKVLYYPLVESVTSNWRLTTPVAGGRGQ